MSFLSFMPKWLRAWLFPLGMCVLYGVVMVVDPEAARRAMHMSGVLFRQVGRPIFMALAIMVLLNRFLSPVTISRFMGRSSGARGVFLSTMAGVLSMGPIYAWYPLFKALRDKGASAFHVANFMSCRAIKPVFFPVIISYFGLRFSVAFVLANLLGAWFVAWVVNLACADRAQPPDIGPQP